MFEKATRLKLRFSSPQGVLSVEDLWDLPLTSARESVANLDAIAIALHQELGKTQVSFVPTGQPSTNDTLQLKLDLVVHVINTKVQEEASRQLALANSARKQQLLSIIAQKENEQLATTDLEELRKIAASL